MILLRLQKPQKLKEKFISAKSGVPVQITGESTGGNCSLKDVEKEPWIGVKLIDLQGRTADRRRFLIRVSGSKRLQLEAPMGSN